jgi:hypothetical protein
MALLDWMEKLPWRFSTACCVIPPLAPTYTFSTARCHSTTISRRLPPPRDCPPPPRVPRRRATSHRELSARSRPEFRFDIIPNSLRTPSSIPPQYNTYLFISYHGIIWFRCNARALTSIDYIARDSHCLLTQYHSRTAPAATHAAVYPHSPSTCVHAQVLEDFSPVSAHIRRPASPFRRAFASSARPALLVLPRYDSTVVVGAEGAAPRRQVVRLLFARSPEESVQAVLAKGLGVRIQWRGCGRRELEMYGPPSRGGGGAGTAGEQPRVYQVWRGSNVSSPSLFFSDPCFFLCSWTVHLDLGVRWLPRVLWEDGRIRVPWCDSTRAVGKLDAAVVR